MSQPEIENEQYHRFVAGRAQDHLRFVSGTHQIRLM